MKISFVHVLLYFLFFINDLIAQSKRGDNWITGYSGNKVSFSSNSISTSQGIYFPFKYFTGGNSCISDTNGNLVLVSDGYNIYNSLGTYIEDGDTLIPLNLFIYEDGWSAESQASIFLPMDSNKYYFITPTFSDLRFDDCVANNNCYFDLLLYNVIDMNANGGAGKVTQRMKPLMQNANLRKTQMMACRHGNGKDWWLLKQEGDYADVHLFLFTQDSVYDKGVQMFVGPVWGPWDLRGQSTFNSDGNKYASTSHGSSTGLIFIAEFDRCYGQLQNPYSIQMPFGSMYDPTDTTKKERLSVGLAFSPNGKLLYVISRRNIYQYDLQDSTWFHVMGLDTSYSQFQDYETAYIGPDNKIYIGNWSGLSKQMSRIDNPDVKGSGCNFCPRCLRLDSLGANAYVGTPPCMPNYSLGVKTCWPLDLTSNPFPQGERNLIVYPNPMSKSLSIKYVTKIHETVTYELANAIGQFMKKGELQPNKTIGIDVSSLPSGVYYLKCEGLNKKIIKE